MGKATLQLQQYPTNSQPRAQRPAQRTSGAIDLVDYHAVGPLGAHHGAHLNSVPDARCERLAGALVAGVDLHGPEAAVPADHVCKSRLAQTCRDRSETKSRLESSGLQAMLLACAVSAGPERSSLALISTGLKPQCLLTTCARAVLPKPACTGQRLNCGRRSLGLQIMRLVCAGPDRWSLALISTSLKPQYLLTTCVRAVLPRPGGTGKRMGC